VILFTTCLYITHNTLFLQSSEEMQTDTINDTRSSLKRNHSLEDFPLLSRSNSIGDLCKTKRKCNGNQRSKTKQSEQQSLQLSEISELCKLKEEVVELRKIVSEITELRKISSEVFELRKVVSEIDQLRKVASDVVNIQKVASEVQCQVNFLLSYVGILDSATAITSSSTSTSSAAGSQSAVDGGQCEAPSGTGGTSVATNSSSKSYSAAAQKPAALCPAFKQAVVSAVYADFEEHERRNKNVIINGLRYDGDTDKRNVEKLLHDEFSPSIAVVKCRRLGQPRSGKTQPLLVLLRSASEAEYLIRDARRLRHSSDQYVSSSVYISADLTKAEALAAYQRRCRRRARTTGSGGSVIEDNLAQQSTAAVPYQGYSTNPAAVNSAAPSSVTLSNIHHQIPVRFTASAPGHNSGSSP
jgi:hypothetical protein